MSLIFNGSAQEVIGGESVHPAVLRATVRSERVVKGGAEGGGDLVIQRIDPPMFTGAELAAIQPPPVRELTEQEKSSRLAALNEARAKAPLETRLFSPNVVEYPGSVSKISWWSVNAQGNFEDHEVWVSGADMSLLPAVGDLNAGRRRWLLTAIVHQSSAKFVPQQQPPSEADFAAKAGDAAAGPVVLVAKGGEDPAALEPLTALLTELKNNAPQLTRTLSAMKAEQESQAAKAAAKALLPPPNSILRYYTTDADAVESGNGPK